MRLKIREGRTLRLTGAWTTYARLTLTVPQRLQQAVGLLALSLPLVGVIYL